MAVYGYARVSTRDQTLASQEAQLRAAACTKIYAEKVSGAWGDRPELAKLLKRLDQGDVLIVTRLDRLARSIRDGLLMAKRKQTWLGASTYRKQRSAGWQRPALSRQAWSPREEGRLMTEPKVRY